MIPVFAIGDPSTALRLLRSKAVLVSHAYIGQKPTAAEPAPKRAKDEWIPWQALEALSAATGELWGDSGAFTYWQRANKGRATRTISVETWAAFIVDNHELFRWLVTLDDIESPAASLSNWRRLIEIVPAEIHPKLVPVWHEGDPVEHLAAYDPGVRLVGLGRTKGRQSGPVGKRLTLAFYDEAFNAYPDGKYHLLGNSNPDTIERYPARSFDATTWQRDSAYSESHGFPWSRVTKETRMRAYIEAIETIRYVPTPPPVQACFPWATS